MLAFCLKVGNEERSIAHLHRSAILPSSVYLMTLSSSLAKIVTTRLQSTKVFMSGSGECVGIVVPSAFFENFLDELSLGLRFYFDELVTGMWIWTVACIRQDEMSSAIKLLCAPFPENGPLFEQVPHPGELSTEVGPHFSQYTYFRKLHYFQNYS